MNVSVGSGRCEGHGMCEASTPDFFTLDGRERAVRMGAEFCPAAALTINES